MTGATVGNRAKARGMTLAAWYCAACGMDHDNERARQCRRCQTARPGLAAAKQPASQGHGTFLKVAGPSQAAGAEVAPTAAEKARSREQDADAKVLMAAYRSLSALNGQHKDLLAGALQQLGYEAPPLVREAETAAELQKKVMALEAAAARKEKAVTNLREQLKTAEADQASIASQLETARAKLQETQDKVKESATKSPPAVTGTEPTPVLQQPADLAAGLGALERSVNQRLDWFQSILGTLAERLPPLPGQQPAGAKRARADEGDPIEDPDGSEQLQMPVDAAAVP